MNSKAKLLIGTGSVLIIGVGVYSYLQNTVETNIEAQIKAFNDRNIGKFNISYESLEANPAAGEFNLKNVKIDINEINGTSTIDNLLISAGIKGGEFTLSGLEADNFNLSSDKINLSFSDFNIEGANLSVFDDKEKLRNLDKFPVNVFHIQDLKLEANSAELSQPFGLSLKEYSLAVDPESEALTAFELDGLNVNFLVSSILPVNMNYGNISIKGGDLSWFDKAIELSQDTFKDNLGDLPEAERIIELQKAQAVFTETMMPVFINYMGIESFEWNDFSVSLPNGSNVSFDKLYVNDLERIDNMVVGGKSGWIDFAAPDLTGFTPELDSQLSLLGLKGTRLTMTSEAHYDQANSASISKSHLSLENIADITIDYTLNNFDPKAYYEKSIAVYSPEVQQNPEKIMEIYAELFKDVSGTLTLTDKSIINRFINGYAAQTGADPEALRAQFTGIAVANLTQLFGAYVPTDLAQAVSGYMASTSVPLVLDIATKEKLSSETINQISAANWGDYIKVDVKQAQQ